MIKYTEEQKKFIKDNNYMKTAEELANMFNKRFGTSLTKENIKTYRGNNNLNSGLTGRFKKGQISFNKGKKWDDFMPKESQSNSLKTCFKKGNKPKNADPIGTEKWKSSHKDRNDEGFLYVKVRDGAKQHNWVAKHRLIWEQNYGPIPKGYKLIFKDGNRHNITIENLELVSNSEMLILNKRNLIYQDTKLTESGILVAKIIDKVNKNAKK